MANTKPLLSCETQGTTVCLHLHMHWTLWAACTVHRDTLSSLHCWNGHFEQPALFTRILWAACTIQRDTLSSLHCSQGHFEQPALYTRTFWAACTVHRDTLGSLHCSLCSCIVYRFIGHMSIQQWRLFPWLPVWLSWQDDVRLHVPARSAPWSVWQKLYWHW